MNLFKNKTSRALIIIMSALVLLSIFISQVYYNNVNESVDPRIVDARHLYTKYNLYAENNQFESVLALMDSIEMIYTKFDHYKNSYEVGVLYNNRAATYLTQAFISDSTTAINQDSLISLAELSIEKSIIFYNLWLEKYSDKTENELESILMEDFYLGLENYESNQKNKYFKNRIDEIVDSQAETDRRLSVAYTNLGIIYRHKLQYDSAAYCYKEAIDLWDRNLTAENNLNKLLGRPEKKRNLIQKLFPPERVQN